MRYENFNRNGKDQTISHYIYLEGAELTNEEELDFLEDNGVDISKIERIEHDCDYDLVIYHEPVIS